MVRVLIDPQMNVAAQALAMLRIDHIYKRAEVIAEQLVPVVTGALQRSINVAKDSKGAPVLKATEKYASFVERGTRRAKAKPYITPGLMRALRGG